MSFKALCSRAIGSPFEAEEKIGAGRAALLLLGDVETVVKTTKTMVYREFMLSLFCSPGRPEHSQPPAVGKRKRLRHLGPLGEAAHNLT
jgi:hypothetical protein